MDFRSQITSLFLSSGYRETSSGNRCRRQATAPVGPAEVARNPVSAADQSSRSGSWGSSAGGS
eukprot:11920809-Alexandrium_andersonii.AAC.1